MKVMDYSKQNKKLIIIKNDLYLIFQKKKYLPESDIIWVTLDALYMVEKEINESYSD